MACVSVLLDGVEDPFNLSGSSEPHFRLDLLLRVPPPEVMNYILLRNGSSVKNVLEVFHCLRNPDLFSHEAPSPNDSVPQHLGFVFLWPEVTLQRCILLHSLGQVRYLNLESSLMKASTSWMNESTLFL